MIALGLAATLASIVIVRWVRSYALRREWLDVPTARSSHEAPTPRGGGLGFAVPIVAALGLAPLAGVAPGVAWPAGLALAGVAGAGWLDDRRGVPIGGRLLVHVGAGIVLAWIAHRLGAGLGMSAAPAAAWWIFWTVSAINVVNFMDGIDGLIGLTAAIFAAFAALALTIPPEAGAGDGAVFPASLAIVALGAVLGFLRYNWPPASIFMGDVGSGTLGALFVLLGIASVAALDWTILHAFLPLTPLFSDEVMTMGRRLSRGERLWVAHRSHVYQRLVQAGWSHGRVAFLYGAVSVLGAGIALGLPRTTGPFLLTALCYLVSSTTLLLVLGHGADRRIV